MRMPKHSDRKLSSLQFGNKSGRKPLQADEWPHLARFERASPSGLAEVWGQGILMKYGLPLILASCLTTLCCAPSQAAVIDSSRADFFERKIRPILMDNCYKCHSPAAPKLKGGLSVATRDALLKGGENGTAIVPGHPEKSKLIEAIQWTNKDLQMPPKTQLSEAAIADLTKWVQIGGAVGRGQSQGSRWANPGELRQAPSDALGLAAGEGSAGASGEEHGVALGRYRQVRPCHDGAERSASGWSGG